MVLLYIYVVIIYFLTTLLHKEILAPDNYPHQPSTSSSSFEQRDVPKLIDFFAGNCTLQYLELINYELNCFYSNVVRKTIIIL